MIFRNTLAQTVTALSGYVFAFVLAPIMLARLGLAQFGVWAVTGGVAVYAGLMDLGITRAVARFVAYYDAHGDRRSVEETVGLGVAAAAVVGAIALTATYFAAPLFSRVLGELDTGEMRIVIMSAAAIMLLQALKTVLAAVPIGLQNMVPPNVALSLGTAVNFILSVTALALSPKLTVYALATVVAEVVSVILVAIVLARVWSPVRVRLPSRRLVRETLSFGLQSQVMWIADIINYQTDKIVIGAIVDVRVAAAYEIAARVVLALKNFAALTISGLVPSATSRLAREGRTMLVGFYRHYTARTTTLAFALYGLACVAAPFLILGWIGEPPPDTVAILVVLTLANVVNIVTGVAVTLSLADPGGVGLLVKASVFSAVVNVGLTIALAPNFGLWGVVVATVIALVTSATLYQVLFHRRYSIPFRALAESILPPAALVAAAAMPFIVLYLAFGMPFETRTAGAVGSALIAASFLAIVLPSADRLGLLPDAISLRARRVRARAEVDA